MGNALIGLFGGTFDPPHLGHINLALELKERKGLSEVWFIPAFVSPFRTQEKSTPSFHRYQMVLKAVEGIPSFKVLDLEIKKEKPSFTVDTLRELLKLYPQQRFSLLLGEDAALSFYQWKEYDQIVKWVDLLVATRKDFSLKEKLKTTACPDDLKEFLLHSLVAISNFDIEATQVRKRLKEKLYCGHLVSAKVLDYIYQNQLYSIL